MLNDFYANFNPVAFSIGSLTVRWYGLAYLCGFVLGGLIFYRTAKHWKLKLSVDDVMMVVLAAAFGIIIGGRLGYCLFYGNGYYLTHPADIIAVWKGGMSFHGGLIGALIAIVIAGKCMKIPVLSLTDLAVIGAPLGLFFGRCANFINGELYGAPTDLPWGVVFANTGGGLVARHPSQLYEALLEGLVILAVMLVLARRNDPPRPRGSFSGVFMIMYALFRIAIEFVRLPDSQIGYLAGDWLTMGMCLSLPLLAAGIALLIWSYKANLPQQGRAA